MPICFHAKSPAIFVSEPLGDGLELDPGVPHARGERMPTSVEAPTPHAGRAMVGGMEVPYPEYPHAESRAAAMYVRPHELEIDRVSAGPSSLTARVLHVNPNGSVVKVRLLAEEFGIAVNVDLAPHRSAELDLRIGEHVYVFPQRFRVFVPDYSI